MGSATTVRDVRRHHGAESVASRQGFFCSLHRHIVISLLVFVMLLHTYTGAVDFLMWPIPAALLIVVLGAPHGALDVALASHRQNLVSAREIAMFLCKYVSLTALIVLVWWLLPGVLLAAFLLVSAYHFGGDWSASAFRGARLLLGAALLCATTIMHGQQVEMIFSWLAPSADAAMIAKVMLMSAPVIIMAASMAAIKLATEQPDVGSEFLVVLAGAVVLPPITFFLIYFCLLHSVRHLFDVRAELQRHSTRELIQAGRPYALLAIFGSLGGALAFAHLEAGPAVLSSVFITMAALTVPHIVLIDWAPATADTSKVAESTE